MNRTRNRATVATLLLTAGLTLSAPAEQVVYLNFGEIGETQTKSNQDICGADGGVIMTLKKGPREGFAPADIGFPNNDNRAASIAAIVAQVTADFGDRNIEFTTTEPAAGTWTTINIVKGGFPNYNINLVGQDWSVDVSTGRATISGGPLNGYYVDLSDAQGKLRRPDNSIVQVPDDMGVNQPVCLPGIAKLPNGQGIAGIAQEIDKGNTNKNKQAWIFVGADTLGMGATAAEQNQRELGASISHELAHLLGLEHADGVKGSILGQTNGTNYGDDKDFTDGTDDPKKDADKKLDGILPAKDPVEPRTRTTKLGDTDLFGTGELGPPTGDPDADAANEAKGLRRVLQPHVVDSPYPVQKSDIQPAITDPPGLDLPIPHGAPALFTLALDPPDPLLPGLAEAWLEIHVANLADVPPPPSDCCAPHPFPGCDDPCCTADVCAADFFCCDMEWDMVCVDLATMICGVCLGGDVQLFVDGIELPGAFDGIDQRFPFPPIPGFTSSERVTFFLDQFLDPAQLQFVLDDGLVDVQINVAGASNFIAIDDIVLIVTDGVPPPCPGDTNGDLVIDIDDIVNVVLDFGCTQPPDCPNGGDVNGDNVVNIDDIVFVVLHFGDVCS